MPENPTPHPSDATPASSVRTNIWSALSWVRDLAFSVLIAVILIVFIYQPVKVEGTSMMPTLTDQERIFREHFARPTIDACRSAFWPVLLAYLKAHGHEPNRGPHRHFLPMPFEPPCFVPDFFFDNEVLSTVRGVMDDRVVADQWGCDVPLRGSDYQGVHIDYQRPLFSEAPDLSLPAYMLVVSFGLVRITPENGPIEIAPGTHRMPGKEALRAVEAAEIAMQPVPLEIGDVLIRHPWALHRGSPNTTDTPRALVSVRYVRPWYADRSREVDSLPQAVWDSLTPEQQQLMRFPVGDRSLISGGMLPGVRGLNRG